MDSRYLEPDIETAARATLRAVQEQRLHEQVEHAYQSSPFYRRKLDAAGVKPADVGSLRTGILGRQWQDLGGKCHQYIS